MRCYLRREKRQIQVLIAISEMIIVSNFNNNYYTNEWDCKNILILIQNVHYRAKYVGSVKGIQ